MANGIDQDLEFINVGAGGGDAGGTVSPVAPTTPQTNDAGKTQEQPAGNIHDDPVFKNLPRAIQVRVERGKMTLKEAVQAAANQSVPGTSPVPQASKKPEQDPARPMPGNNDGSMNVQPTVPIEFSGGPSRLSAGQVLEGGRTGIETFARPGSRGYRAFSGQEFNPYFLRPEARMAGGAALSMRDALRAGSVGRQVLRGGGNLGLLPGENGRKSFLRDVRIG